MRALGLQGLCKVLVGSLLPSPRKSHSEALLGTPRPLIWARVGHLFTVPTFGGDEAGANMKRNALRCI